MPNRRGVGVLAFAHYQPARVVDNAELAQLVETSDQWIRQRTGIATRRYAADGESLVDMGCAAATAALARAGLTTEQCDLVVVSVSATSERSPNVASQLALRLGMRSPGAIDINTACSGFVHALALAQQSISTGVAKTALVVGAEKVTDVTDWNDRSTCVLFGDGAGAAVLGESSRQAMGPVVWGSDPDRGFAIRLDGSHQKLTMDGKVVFRWASTALPPVAREACDKAGISVSDIKAFIPHQANLRITEMLTHELGLTEAVVSQDIIESGNTSSASIPIAASKLIASGRVQRGDWMLLLGFGAGLTYAAQAVQCP